MDNKHTAEELKQWQALPLNVKVLMTKRRIHDWVMNYGSDGVYVSFSGGKDSTVLLHMVREMFPDIPAVFFDTGLEYPEIRDFVKTFDCVTWLRPKMTFRKVIETYGYPFISKEVSGCLHDARKRIEKGLPLNSYKAQQLQGISRDPKGNLSRYNIPQYRFLLDAPFKVSDRCCGVMKKSLSHKYAKETGRMPFIATMATESLLRRQAWIRNGCNAFESKHPKSTPMAFWTETDVLQYAKDNNIKFCSLYGDIVEEDQLPNQMTWKEYAGFDTGQPKLKTTGLNRKKKGKENLKP